MRIGKQPGIGRRLLSLVVLLWVLGFAWFALVLPQPIGAGRSDAVIVPTGGEGRIGRGLEALDRGWARKMLVAGVDREVKPREFAAEYRVAPRRMACCITLDTESVDTRTNARIAADWIAKNNVRSVRLVTSDWHMRRAAWELEHVVPANVMIARDAVRSRPSLRILFLEYNKLLARRLGALVGL
jgi:uncharacterized SAM-binding protein YcdF (DUF218 family)